MYTIYEVLFSIFEWLNGLSVNRGSRARARTKITDIQSSIDSFMP